MAEKRKSFKNCGIILAVSFVVVLAVTIPTVLYFITSPPLLDITYNYETTQEEAIIIEHENIDHSSIYFSNSEFLSDSSSFINISEILHKANLKSRRIFRDYELSYAASICLLYNNNITQLNNTNVQPANIYLSYYNSTSSNYSFIVSLSIIFDKLVEINDTGLLDDGYYFISYNLFENERIDFLTQVDTSIDRKIICDSAGKPLLIISFEQSIVYS
ncbi:MAG: hypothetical protein EAX90_06885 [Candidatus Heimdallarchaeota archaeon]|nr:hypothetical protein [Candidatus Heimdallarchaeota archaeon]